MIEKEKKGPSQTNSTKIKTKLVFKFTWFINKGNFFTLHNILIFFYIYKIARIINIYGNIFKAIKRYLVQFKTKSLKVIIQWKSS